MSAPDRERDRATPAERAAEEALARQEPRTASLRREAEEQAARLVRPAARPNPVASAFIVRRPLYEHEYVVAHVPTDSGVMRQHYSAQLNRSGELDWAFRFVYEPQVAQTSEAIFFRDHIAMMNARVAELRRLDQLGRTLYQESRDRASLMSQLPADVRSLIAQRFGDRSMPP